MRPLPGIEAHFKPFFFRRAQVDGGVGACARRVTSAGQATVRAKRWARVCAPHRGRCSRSFCCQRLAQGFGLLKALSHIAHDRADAEHPVFGVEERHD